MILKVTASAVNLRSAPDAASQRIGCPLGKGASLTLLGTEGVWRKVETGDRRIGWVHGDYVKPVAPVRGWRVARSLQVLLSQVNRIAPHRSHKYDGSIGDAAHQSRESDHNPHVADPTGEAKGVVTALDITHDPARGCDCRRLVSRIVAFRDPRVKYLIFNGKIWRSYVTKRSPAAWKPQEYTGENQHVHHLHVSVVGEPELFDSPLPWRIE